MVKNISIGQYYPIDSFIHSLDARVKLIATFLYITVIFLLQNYFSYIFVAICLGLVIYASKVPVKFIVKGLKGIFFIVIFTAVLNVFFTPSGYVLVNIFGLKITLDGILIALRMAVRLVLLLCGTSVLTLTTSPIELTSAIEFLLNPLKRLKVPAHEIAMMMTIALRFIPALLEEMDKIMKAQTARGADFDTGGLVKKIKSLIPLLVPLFISAFRRADELATAMEARCYQGDSGRTRMKEMRLRKRDLRAITLLAFFTLAAMLLNYMPFST